MSITYNNTVLHCKWCFDVNQSINDVVWKNPTLGLGHEQQMKTLANGEIKILTGDEHQFRRTIKVLEEQKVEYHRYQLKTEKKFREVIRGLHPETDPCDIKNELSELGHHVHTLTNIKIKKKNNPNNKFSDRTIVRLLLFFVDLEPQANNKDIYEIKNLCYHIIKVESPRKKKRSATVQKLPNIWSHSKLLFQNTKAKSANCGEGHTANWKGCITYKNAIEKAHPKKNYSSTKNTKKTSETSHSNQ
ncbi:Uncharacterized protein FWK35_00023125 [Aphis craccivora]|uniref:Pre-C2HC domain-containing protein n=1 Tax=Aphis craccivora TaxID=307492 RepID=A0A6G0XK55_APHCR|nr:Uncharacterized protein FWK35_00023125 [Aphis craccivora]